MQNVQLNPNSLSKTVNFLLVLVFWKQTSRSESKLDEECIACLLTTPITGKMRDTMTVLCHRT